MIFSQNKDLKLNFDKIFSRNTKPTVQSMHITTRPDREYIFQGQNIRHRLDYFRPKYPYMRPSS